MLIAMVQVQSTREKLESRIFCKCLRKCSEGNVRVPQAEALPSLCALEEMWRRNAARH